jgi:hypothetical protein
MDLFMTYGLFCLGYADRIYFVGNAGNKTLDIQLGWTRFLTWSIRTLQTPSGFPQSCPLTQCAVLDVVKVLL